LLQQHNRSENATRRHAARILTAARRELIAWVFYLDALSFVLSAVCIGLVGITPLAMDEVTNVASVLRNLRAGVRFLADSAILRSLLIVSVTIFLSYGLWNVLLLPFALRALHATEFEYGLQEGLTSVGFVLGSLLMVRIADQLREGQWIAIGVLGMAIAGVAYALVGSILLAIALVMVSGFMNAPSAVGRRLVVQRNTPRETRGLGSAHKSWVKFGFGMSIGMHSAVVPW
jgi:hypothetical protein